MQTVCFLRLARRWLGFWANWSADGHLWRTTRIAVHGPAGPFGSQWRGGGTELNIGWSHADSMRKAILEIAARAHVIVYDRQADQLIPPRGNTIRKLFKRRG
jgi:hypothetical protein